MTLEARLILAALACWRLSSLIVRESGPLDLFARLRTMAMRWASLVSCIWCLSIWVGVVTAALALTDGWVLLIPFALSAVAIGMDRLVYIRS